MTSSRGLKTTRGKWGEGTVGEVGPLPSSEWFGVGEEEVEVEEEVDGGRSVDSSSRSRARVRG